MIQCLRDALGKRDSDRFSDDQIRAALERHHTYVHCGELILVHSNAETKTYKAIHRSWDEGTYIGSEKQFNIKPVREKLKYGLFDLPNDKFDTPPDITGSNYDVARAALSLLS